jgi:Flp pilus assembly protein TadG
MWVMVLALAVMLLGGIGIDLWRALAEHRELAGIADAAAAAGSSGVDLEEFRRSGEVRLAPDLATDLALTVLAAQPDAGDLSAAPVIEVDPSQVTVLLRRTVDLTLLGPLAAGQTVEVSARATADAAFRP